MVDFTRQVPDVNVPAVRPLQTNQGSTAADVVKAISFGIETFQRGKQVQAQEEKQQHQLRLREATDAVISFENMQDSTGVKRERAVAAEIDRLAGVLEVDRLDLRTMVGQVRGRTTAKGIREELSSEEKAAQAAQDERQAIELQIAQDIAFLPGVGLDAVQSASDKELDRMLLESQANKSRFNARQATLEQQAASARSAEQSRAITVRSYTDNFMFHYNGQLNDIVQQQLTGLDRSDPEAVKNFLDTTRNARFLLPEAIRQGARELGLGLSTQEVNDIVGEASSRFDTLEMIAKRDDFATLSDQQLKVMTNDLMFDMFESDDPAQRQAGSALMVAKVADAPPEIGAFNEALKMGIRRAVAGNTQQSKDTLRNSMQSEGASEKEIEAAERKIDDSISGMYNPAVKDIPDQYKDSATNSILNDFAAPRAKLESMVRSGTFMAHLEGLAGERGGEVIQEDMKPEVLETIAPVVGDVLVSTISTFLRQPQDIRAIRAPGESIFGQSTGERNFNIDPQSLRISPAGNAATTKHTKQSRKINHLIETSIKAYENLGASSEEIEQLKDEIRNVFGLVPTDQGNKPKEDKTLEDIIKE